MLFEDTKRIFRPHARPIRTVGGHCVVRVGDVDDAGRERSFLTDEAMRISGAVPILMMQFHSAEVWSKAMHSLQDLAADLGMLTNSAQILAGKLSRTLQNIIGNPDFSDVVQQRSDAELVELRGVESQTFRDGAGIFAHPMAVPGCIAVSRIKSTRQGTNTLDVGSVKILLAVANNRGCATKTVDQFAYFSDVIPSKMLAEAPILVII